MSSWIRHIKKDIGIAFCGYKILGHWYYQDYEHAYLSLKNRDRLMPCKKCLSIAEKEKK